MSSKSEFEGYGYCKYCGKKYNYKENYILSEELDLRQDNRVSVTPGEELDLRQGDRISVISGGGIDLGHGVFIRIAPSGFLIWVRDAGNHLTITSLKGIDIEKITS